MRPSATRPTSFWRGESGPFVGLSDAPILIAISSQGFLMRSRMRVFFQAGRYMLSLLICSVSAFLLLWLRQHVAAMAWEAAAKSSSILTACECIFTRGFGAAQKSLKPVHASGFFPSYASPEAFISFRGTPESRKARVS